MTLPPFTRHAAASALLLSPFGLLCTGACSDDDGLISEESEETGPEGGGQGGQGGAPGSEGGAKSDGGTGGLQVEVPELSEDPLYGEGGVPPQELRLVFQEIPIAAVGSGTDIAFLPHDGDLSKSSLLLLSRNNKIHLVDVHQGETEVRASWDFADEAVSEYACAPTNVLLDRNFDENHFIYITKCAEVQTTQLLRFTFDEEEGLSDRQLIFETTHPDTSAPWHRMGSMGWESEDVLWLLVGDHDDAGGNESAQDVTNPLGALVRILPNRKAGRAGHAIPPGNFASQPGAPENVHPSIYAYGFRSPWRGTRDSLGRYWVGDVGLTGFEEVNIVVDPGENFGWNLHEGLCEEDCDAFIDPVVAYDRSAQHRYLQEEPMAGGSSQRAIWVGEIYENPTVDRYEGLMDGVVPFGDLFVGFVRGLRAAQRPQPNWNAAIGQLTNVTAWKLGSDGYAYALDLFGNLHVALLDYD